jgi:hypothetical protein
MPVRDGTKYGGPFGLSGGCYRPSESDPVVEVVGKPSSRPNYMTASQCRERLNQVMGLLKYHADEFDEEQRRYLQGEVDELRKALGE